MSAQGPLVLDLGLKGLGLRVWGQGLTIFHQMESRYRLTCCDASMFVRGPWFGYEMTNEESIALYVEYF